MKQFVLFYWIFIFVIQGYILSYKVPKDEFYLWNVVAILSAILFISARLYSKKVLKVAESVIALFLIFNCISFAVVSVIKGDNIMLLGCILIGIFSIVALIAINKKET